MKNPAKRPALAGMGLWVWPAAGLLVFSAGMLVPYIQNAGRPKPHPEEVGLSGEVAGCAVNLQILTTERATRMRGAIDRLCAHRIESLTLRLFDQQGELIGERSLRGNPNALSATVKRQPDACAPARIELELAGAEARISWSLPPHKDKSAENGHSLKAR